MAGARLVLGGLAAVPQPDVEHARRDAGALGQQLTRVDRAGADLALGPAGREQLAAVDVVRERVVVVQDAVAQLSGVETKQGEVRPLRPVRGPNPAGG